MLHRILAVKTYENYITGELTQTKIGRGLY
jgi:hypothetical protein